MPNFKIWVSKDGKRYNIVYKAENEGSARSRVHEEWYSILSLEEVLNHDILWNIFNWCSKENNCCSLHITTLFLTALISLISLPSNLMK